MRIVTMLFFVIFSSITLFAQDTPGKNTVTLDGIALGMSKEQVLKVKPEAASNDMNNNLWLFDSTSLSISFDENGLVSEVMSDDVISSIIVNGFEIKQESSIESVFEFLGQPDETFKTEMVAEYYFEDTCIVILTYADDSEIKLLSLQKNYDK